MKFIPAARYGIKSESIRVVNEQGRVIGYLPNEKAIPAFLAGDTSEFRPVSDWKLTFSPSLAQQLKLI